MDDRIRVRGSEMQRSLPSRLSVVESVGVRKAKQSCRSRKRSGEKRKWWKIVEEEEAMALISADVGALHIMYVHVHQSSSRWDRQRCVPCMHACGCGCALCICVCVCVCGCMHMYVHASMHVHMHMHLCMLVGSMSMMWSNIEGSTRNQEVIIAC
jgi:hypothetical protein